MQGVMSSVSAIEVQQWVSKTRDEQDTSGNVDAFFKRATATPSVDESQFAYSDSPSSSVTEMASAYDTVFEQQLKDCNIFLDHPQQADGQRLLPRNLPEIQKALKRRRTSLSTNSETQRLFVELEYETNRASTETMVMSKILPILLGKDEFPFTQNLVCKNYAPLGMSALVCAKPNHYDGADIDELDRNIREELNRYIVPSLHVNIPIMPNFFVELKGPDGSPNVTRRQVLYYGTLGARGMHEVNAFANNDNTSIYDENAYTFSISYHPIHAVLCIYTTHVVKPIGPDHLPSYCTRPLQSWSLTGSQRAFVEGVTAARNMQAFAAEKRHEVITAANFRAKKRLRDLSLKDECEIDDRPEDHVSKRRKNSTPQRTISKGQTKKAPVRSRSAKPRV